MLRLILGSAVAAIAVFFWGFLAWPGMNLYEGWAIKNLTNPDAVVHTLQQGVSGDGAYFFPPFVHRDDMTDEEQAAATDAWTAKSQAGPVGLIVYRQQGADPQDPMLLVRGFGITFLGALLLGTVLIGSGRRSYAGRWLVGAMAIAFAMAITYGIMWNYFRFPENFTKAMLMDCGIGWGIGLTVLAAFVKPRHTA